MNKNVCQRYNDDLYIENMIKIICFPVMTCLSFIVIDTLSSLSTGTNFINLQFLDGQAIIARGTMICNKTKKTYHANLDYCRILFSTYSFK
jgi:hypothetical protein